MRHRTVKPAALCDNTEFGGYAAGFLRQACAFCFLMTGKWPIQKVAQSFCGGRHGFVHEIPKHQRELPAIFLRFKEDFYNVISKWRVAHFI
jgi:hypothetical protein